MKKLFVIILSLIFVLSACGNTDDVIYYEQVDTSNDFLENVNVCYQVFPIAFATGIEHKKKGNIRGIIDNLDYLSEELRVDCIWLNPVHPSPSYHKYDVVDYYEIDPVFGTLDDYKELLDEAHKRDIRVLMDFVVNHTSSQHPWFLESKSSLDNEYRDYYVWNTLEDTDQFPNTTGWVNKGKYSYFASFWSEMPELNMDNPKVREEIMNIATYWLEMGVDGFRIDAAKHIYDPKEYPKDVNTLEKNVEFFKELNHHMKQTNPDSFLLSEIWTSSSGIAPYLQGMDSAFSFDTGESIIDAINTSSRSAIQNKIEQIDKSYSKYRVDYINSTFLTNHDQDRVMSILGNDIDKAKMTAHLLFTLPGLPWVYYGEELGMKGFKPDEQIREPFKWTDNQVDNPNSMWIRWDYNKELDSLETQKDDLTSMFNTYKALINMRQDYDVLNKGVYRSFNIDGIKFIYPFIREYEGTKFLVVHNLSRYEQNISFTSDSFHINLVEMLVYNSSVGSTINNDSVLFKPHSTVIFEITDENILIEKVK